MTDTITGYVNPDGSGQGNWVAAETCTCPLCRALLELAASALRTRTEADARRRRLRLVRRRGVPAPKRR